MNIYSKHVIHVYNFTFRFCPVDPDGFLLKRSVLYYEQEIIQNNKAQKDIKKSKTCKKVIHRIHLCIDHLCIRKCISCICTGLIRL